LKTKASGSNSVVECQLPKLDVAGSTPVSRSIFLQHLQALEQQVGSNWLHLVYGEGCLQLIDGVAPTLERSPGINVFVHINGVPHLLGPDLRIYVELL
jgi:hypothetical protein